MSHTAHPPARPDIAPMIGPIAAERPAPVARTPELSVRVGETGWDQGLGERMVLMAGKREQVAELHLNPPELGPLKIVLTLADDQASAQFVSAHAPVRDAVEQALPRLQQMLADNGITLGNASVSAETFRQPEQQASERGAPRPAMSEDAPPAMHASAPLRALRGLVDTFA